MVSEADAKIGLTYTNAQDSVPVQTWLIKMGHPHPPTKIQIDNTAVEVFFKGTAKQKMSKAKDMRFYWP